MIYKQDWMMQQIERMVNTLIFFITGKRGVTAQKMELEESSYRDNPAYKEIFELIEGRRLLEAEEAVDCLIEQDPEADLSAVVGVYVKLNELTDEELKEAGYSRARIFEGLKRISKLYGLNIYGE